MATSPVLFVYYPPLNDDSWPGVPGRHITEADWARFSLSQRRTVENATTQEGYTRRKVWVHIDLVDETEQERADREAAEAAARAEFDRKNSLVRYGQIEAMIDQLEVLPPAEEFAALRADVDAVADVPPRVDAVETALESKADTATVNALSSTVSTVQDTAARLDTLTYDVERFVPASASRADAWQSAIDTAFAAGGGTVTSSKRGDHVMTKGLTLYDGVYVALPGSGSVHLDFSGISAPVGGSAIYGAGALDPLPALAANVERHGRTITFASAPSIVPGDVVVLYDSADGSFNPSRTYYRAGEFVRVKSVVENTVTLTSATYAAYASGSTVSAFVLRPIRTGVSGASITVKAGVTGIRVSRGTGLRFDDLNLRGSDQSHLMLDRCYDVALSGVHAWDAQPEVALNYGVSLSNCQNVTLSDCFLETTRHGLTLTGTNVQGCIPNRDITVSGGRISGHSAGANVTGCNMHGNVEYVSFVDVSMPHGCTIAGDHTKVRGGFIRSTGEGRAIHATEMLGWDHQFEDVEIELTADSVLSKGVVNFESPDTITRTGGTFRFRGRFTPHSYGSGQGLIYLVNNGAAANDVDIQITALSEAAPTIGTDSHAVNVTAANGGGFRRVSVTSRLRGRGVRVACSPESVVLRDNQIEEPPRIGLSVIYIGSPFYPATTVDSADNRVERAGENGIYYRPHIDGTKGMIRSVNDMALDCNRAGGGVGATGSAITLRAAQRVVYRGGIVGDTQAIPTQTHRDVVMDAATVIEEDVANLGSVTTVLRSGIGTHHYRGRGAGAPTLACADGSTYLRTDGGAGATLYVREGGDWVAK